MGPGEPISFSPGSPGAPPDPRSPFEDRSNFSKLTILWRKAFVSQMYGLHTLGPDDPSGPGSPCAPRVPWKMKCIQKQTGHMLLSMTDVKIKILIQSGFQKS